MYSPEQLQIAERNIRLYVFVKIFAKRVFLPLSAIYFIDHAGFSIPDIGLLATVFYLTQLLVQIPTGLFADKFGRVNSIRVAAALCMMATLLYVLAANKIGVFSGQILEAIGYGFLTGAGEAMIHDALVVQKRVGDYTKVVSRAQSVSLLINAVLLALVPMTYALNPRAPFLLGTVAYGGLLFFALRMKEITLPQPVRATAQKFSFTKLVQLKGLLGYALLFGIIAVLYTGTTDLTNLAFRDLGFKPELLGWLFAASSLVGAVIGAYFHVLKRFKLVVYLLLDCLMAFLPLAAIYFQSLPFMIVAVVLSLSFWRFRKIIYQDYLFQRYPTSYKATLISGMGYAEQLHQLWFPAALALLVSKTSLSYGFGIAALCALIISPVFIYTSLKLFGSHRQSNTA